MYFNTKNYLKSSHNYTPTLRKTRFYLFEMANVKSLALFYIYQSKEKKKRKETLIAVISLVMHSTLHIEISTGISFFS
jgi:putative alpha-1,2-mannosidase